MVCACACVCMCVRAYVCVCVCGGMCIGEKRRGWSWAGLPTARSRARMWVPVGPERASPIGGLERGLEPE